MKFLNLNTGYSFDALWTENQEKGYIFWFPAEQSIELTYTMPIAIVTNTNTALTLTIEENDIFSFIQSTNNEKTIDGYVFNGEPNYSNTFSTAPEKISDSKYVHVFNVACKSDNAGEYVCKINIGDNGYIRVGADFYGEHEPAYINLSNMGVELPVSIQKAIYDSNVHEDITDNILINRKFKELLSNYWDIIANKGSYKSLFNSLKWFEWENQLKIHEIYKHVNADKTIFNNKDIISSLNKNITDTFNNFLKTTYISLYCSLQNELPTYDNEYNPNLSQAVFKWSKEDIQLKIALLAKFLGKYFLPIHISILHAAVEDIVFTNTIKTIHGSDIKRNDTFEDIEYIECNIMDKDIFTLSNIKAYSYENTVFATDNKEMFGVDTSIKSNTSLKRCYNGPGAIIPIKLIIPNRNQKEFVKQTIIDYTTDINKDVIKSLSFYNIFNAENNNIEINFNFLATIAAQHIINFTFILSNSKTITRTVKINVEDIENLNINIYRVKSKNDINGFTVDDFYDTSCSKYLFKIQNISNSYYMQYLPYMHPNNKNYKNYTGIKLNRTIVVKVNNTDNIEILKYYMCDIYKFLYFAKEKDGNITYLTFISSKFNDKYPSNILINYNVIRNDLVFYPQFHYLEKIDGNTINDYTVSQYDAICCAAEINNNNEIIPFKYGHMITASEWNFYNNLTNEIINHPATSQFPFIADSKNILNPGYYDIVFRYSLNNGTTNECKLKSAFRIKTI